MLFLIRSNQKSLSRILAGAVSTNPVIEKRGRIHLIRLSSLFALSSTDLGPHVGQPRTAYFEKLSVPIRSVKGPVPPSRIPLMPRRF